MYMSYSLNSWYPPEHTLIIMLAEMIPYVTPFKDFSSSSYEVGFGIEDSRFPPGRPLSVM